MCINIWGTHTSRCRSELKSSSKCRRAARRHFELPPEVDRHRESGSRLAQNIYAQTNVHFEWLKERGFRFQRRWTWTAARKRKCTAPPEKTAKVRSARIAADSAAKWFSERRDHGQVWSGVARCRWRCRRAVRDCSGSSCQAAAKGMMMAYNLRLSNLQISCTHVRPRLPRKGGW